MTFVGLINVGQKLSLFHITMLLKVYVKIWINLYFLAARGSDIKKVHLSGVSRVKARILSPQATHTVNLKYNKLAHSREATQNFWIKN